jgi:hypothetical protein
MRILIFGLLIRVIIAFINSYFGPTLGAEGDALGFHDLATSIATDKFTGAFDETKSAVGWEYASFLAMFYGFAEPSLFLGCLLSCIAWLISGILVDKTLSVLSVDSISRKRALIIYAFLPSGLLFTSVTLREVYQLLFINLAIFSIIKIALNKNFLYWIALVLACFVMSSLHLGLSAYALILIGAAFFLISLRSARGFPFMKFLIFTPIIFIGIYFGLSAYMDSVDYDFSEGIARAVAEYRSGHNETRAMYAEPPELNSFLDLLLFIPIAIFQYFLEPFPWHISTLFDIALFFENLFRLILIIVIIKNIFMLTGQIRIIGVFLFILFLILETMWALGTVNWGSAARHHIPGLGLLVISTFYILAYKNRTANLPS